MDIADWNLVPLVRPLAMTASCNCLAISLAGRVKMPSGKSMAKDVSCTFLTHRWGLRGAVPALFVFLALIMPFSFIKNIKGRHINCGEFFYSCYKELRRARKSGCSAKMYISIFALRTPSFTEYTVYFFFLRNIGKPVFAFSITS